METAIRGNPAEVSLACKAVAEPAAFGPIYDLYFPRVYNYIRYRLRHPDLTDDITALTFERALVRIGSFDPDRATLATWLLAIARNAVNDHLRARQRRRFVSLEWLRGRASEEPGAEEELIGQERKEQLLIALSRLQDRERDILALKFSAGLTNRQISRLTRLSASNVGVILHRAVSRLRRELGAEEGNR